MISEEVLEKRVDILSIDLFGSLEGSSNQSVDLKQKLESLNRRVDTLNHDVPNVKVCEDLIQKIGPILLQQRFSIARAEEKVLKLLLDRDNLFRTIQMLTDIARLSSVNKEFLQDIESYTGQLTVLDATITSLKTSIRKQTETLDRFLDIYQTSMDSLSEAVLGIEAKIEILEKKKGLQAGGRSSQVS